MSDALTDINRDNDINELTNKITMLWLSDQDYSSEMSQLKTMSRGYFQPRGEKVANFIEDLFSKCNGDKFVYLSPHFFRGEYTPEQIRIKVERFKKMQIEEN